MTITLESTDLGRLREQASRHKLTRILKKLGPQSSSHSQEPAPELAFRDPGNFDPRQADRVPISKKVSGRQNTAVTRCGAHSILASLLGVVQSAVGSLDNVARGHTGG
jgi:hypothetical protein